MNALHFSLTVTGTIDPIGGDVDAIDIAMTEADLQFQLNQIVKDALGHGMFTGDTPATLEDYSSTIEISAKALEGEGIPTLAVEEGQLSVLPVNRMTLQALMRTIDAYTRSDVGLECVIDTCCIDEDVSAFLKATLGIDLAGQEGYVLVYADECLSEDDPPGPIQDASDAFFVAGLKPEAFEAVVRRYDVYARSDSHEEFILDTQGYEASDLAELSRLAGIDFSGVEGYVACYLDQ